MPETETKVELLDDEYTDNYPNIPPNLLVALRRYARDHVAVGGFLTAVLENDLVNAAGRADPFNRPHIADLALWCYNCLPGGCWGSPANVAAWLAFE